MLAVIFAIGANGIVMAANDVGHQAHCVDAYDEAPQDDMALHDHDHGHDMSRMVAHHADPVHDHETCMMHACPAISADVMQLSNLTDIFLGELIWPEQPLLALELADALKRPPKS